MKSVLALALIPALCVATPVALDARDAPDPTQVLINGVTFGGTGCPQGTVGTAISADRTLLTLIFDSYVASIGTGVPVTENRKNCQLNVDLLYPPGFQYSVFTVDYRGYAALTKNVTGTLKSTYYFSGQTTQSSSTATIVGPASGDYLKHDETISTSVVWSPCGKEGLLNINSQIRLASTSSTGSGLLTTDSIDAKFRQIAYINWQRCTA